MIIKKMDDILMEINGIKNIEEIQFSELIPTNSEDYVTIIPCLYVRYNSGKVIYLCSNDKYFDVFVKKVVSVYNDEKNKEVVDDDYDPFKVSKLRIDEKTKKILESGLLSSTLDIYQLYVGKKSYDSDFLVEKEEVNGLLSFLLYQIKSVYELSDLVISFDNNKLNGYRTNYTINCKIDGIDVLLYINYKKISDNEYGFVVRSKDKSFKKLDIKIEFGKENIIVKTIIGDNEVFISDSYFNEEERLRHVLSVNKDGKQIGYKDEYLEKTVNFYQAITDLESNSSGMTWYRLPWNSMYGIKDSKDEISNIESIHDVHSKYFTIDEHSYFLREYYGKKYERARTFEVDNYKITLDECFKRVSGIMLTDDIYLIETYFLNNNGGNGYYKNYFDSKYFYHLLDTKKGFKRDNLVAISQDDDIIYGSDLQENVLKLVRGK